MKKTILALAAAASLGLAYTGTAEAAPRSMVGYATNIKNAAAQERFVDSMIVNYTRAVSSFGNLVNIYGARFGNQAWFKPIVAQYAWYQAELEKYQALKSSLNSTPAPVVVTVTNVAKAVAYSTTVETKPAEIVNSTESVVEETVDKTINVYAVLTKLLSTTTVTTKYATTTTTTTYSDGNTKVESATVVDSTSQDVKTETVVARELIATRAVPVEETPEQVVADVQAPVDQVEGQTGTATLNVLTKEQYLARADVELSGTDTYKQAVWKMNAGINEDYITRSSGLRAYGNALSAVGAPDAWARGWTGKGSTIAILDTGIDLDHPEFAGRILDAKCFTGMCDIGKETVDDGNGHGTHVAGIAAAALDGVGTTGVAPDANLLIAKVAYNNGFYDLSKSGAALTWAVNNGAVVANMSGNYNVDAVYSRSMVEIEPGLYRSTDTRGSYTTLGYSHLLAPTSSLNGIREAMQGNELVVVASAGNQRLKFSTFPAHMAVMENADGSLALGGRMIVAGNWDLRLQTLASVSNAAGTVCYDYNATQNTCNGKYRVKDFYLMAPGMYVASTSNDGEYVTKSGTSMAAPTITGAVAVIHQMWPHMKGENLVKLLLNTGNKNLPGYDENIHGQGLLDLAAATSPQGAIGIPTTGRVDGAKKAVTGGTIAVAGAQISALDNVMVVDDYARDFYVNANSLVVAADTRMVNPTVVAQSNSKVDTYLAYAGGVQLPVAGNTMFSLSPDSTKFGVAQKFGNVTVGVVNEKVTFLGNTAQSDLMRINGATTTFVGYTAESKNGNWTMFGNATLGVTRLNVDSSTYIKSADLMLSNSATLGARYEFSQSSEIGFVAALPVSFVAGKAHFTLPSSISDDGSVNYSNVNTSLGSKTREYNLGMFFNTKLDKATSIGTRVEHRANRAGVSGSKDTSVNVTMKVMF